MILVLNCGSQSIKWKVFASPDEVLAKSGCLTCIKEGKRVILNLDDFEKCLEEELSNLKDFKISVIGHRVVHGGSKFLKPTKVTPEVLKDLEKLNYLAPLHNPYNILGIRACQNIFKNIPQIAVFDTEFFKDLPEKSYTYALPEKIVKKFNFKRFGFHGISHEYVAKSASKIIKKPFNKLKIITCHLGGGASITAIKNGKAVDTSMGFTPQEGLVMMTRPGNIDAGIILELVKVFSIDSANEILNKESGIKGICGEGDMLKVLSRLERDPTVVGEKNKYQLALDVFVYSIQKYIGSYFAILGGCDVLVFTGTIGFGSKKIRDMICKDLKILSKTKILATETNEELAIAEKVLKNSSLRGA